MSRGGRCILIAFVGWLSLAAAQHPTQKQGNTAQPAKVEQPPPSYAPYAPLSKDACYRSQSHDAADLCAQWRAAFAAERAAKAARDAVTWTIVGTFLSAIALGGLFLTLRQTENALGEARRGNQISEDTAKRELRAYVLPKDHAITQCYPLGRLTFLVKLQNFGQTPASELRFRTLVRATEGDPEEYKIMFREARQVGPFSDALLGPTDYHVHENAMEKAIELDTWQRVADGRLKLIFAGIISYRDVFGRRRLTTFKYLFVPPDTAWTKAQLLDLSACSTGNYAN